MDNRTHSGEPGTADLLAAADAAHLGRALVAARARTGARIGRMAKLSGGRFRREDLRAHEGGTRAMDGETMSALAQLYGCDLRAALPPRSPVAIESDRVTAGEMSATYDPTDHTTVMPAYVRLVRMLRGARPDDELDLRRPDLQVVSVYWAHCMMEQVHARTGARDDVSAA